MKYIAHRGLLNGPDPEKENTPEQITLALAEGFDVEVDVWWTNGHWWLGHDEPKHQTSLSFLRTKGLWIHCKNTEALARLSDTRLHYFWHQTDCYTLTSKAVPWVYPGKHLFENAVCVMPEETMDLSETKHLKVYGICSDYIQEILKIRNLT